ncbi:GNAT family N-acetyltransferase [Amycolatopsis sp. QT-25]|uniref:GNAT family N-acetyltransferase n=1 Tax=Amycolatopsis sp. QT-25 TaxID=3034022 RepID=UPI0023EB14B6|nr:GNAT family N-acetyltransferase [Amycolatopsis sp. QT-25]WET76275.1 GNAT family N-acetyltransferase [Amycolatopsis sp. QT-25]
MSTKSTRVLVLTCSTRPGGLGPSVTRWWLDTVAERAAKSGVELEPVALGDLDLPFLDEEEHPSSGIYKHEHTRRWSALVDSVDAIVAVIPEYNFGMPATLKNALDYLSAEWAWKPIGFVSYGNTSAGTRAVQHAKQIVTALRLVPLGATVAIRIGEAVAAGRLRANASRDEMGVALLEELVRVANALRPLRERLRDTTSAGPLAGSYTRRLTPDDAEEVAVLQRCCWVDEALLNDTLDIPALRESLDEVREWLADWHVRGLWLDARLLGMVRARAVDGDWQIGRLGVVPDLRGRGLGRWLLRGAESVADADTRRVLIFTGANSTRNITLYESEGYRRIPVAGPAGAVCLTKAMPQERRKGSW